MDSPKLSEEDVAKSFRKLYRKAEAFGLTEKQLASLQSVRGLQAPLLSKSRKRLLKTSVLYPCLCVLLAVVAIPCISLVSEWPMSPEKLARLCLETVGLDSEDIINNDWCLVRAPDELLDFFRPPLKCDFCRGITSVEKVGGISPEEFEKKYAYSGRPVVVTDATRNWTALEAFSFEFLKDIYKPDSPVLKSSHDSCQFFPYKTSFESLAQVFNMSTERAHGNGEPWYIGWSNCDSSAANLIRNHYSRPYFLPRVSESSKTDWIFMGSPGYGAHMHVDNVGQPSWQAMISGAKLWRLEPPPECYYECGPPFDVVVEPGETIVLDTNIWYHSTLITGDRMSIAIGSEYD